MGKPKRKKKLMRGFAVMSLKQRKEIAAMGGRAQGKEKNAGNFANNPKRAAEAGRKGGLASGSA